jgi:demethylmenaquinone methyltransferase/2-methoxy-6-polyprenyl-1,4-benzoquinol methylase
MQYTKTEPETIQKLFASIAQRYDLLNAVLSFRLHKRWNRLFVDELMKEKPCLELLDLCGGTGDIAFLGFERKKELQAAVIFDFCEEMLTCAQYKWAKNPLVHNKKVQFIQGDAHQLPFPTQSFDRVSIAYGIRNVKNPKLVAEETFRVLKSGGKFGILELTRPTNFLMRVGHKVYLKAILPLFGRLLAKNQSAYEYLSSSIGEFIPPNQLVVILTSAGFTKITVKSLSGGISSILTAVKP